MCRLMQIYWNIATINCFEMKESLVKTKSSFLLREARTQKAKRVFKVKIAFFLMRRYNLGRRKGR